MNNVIKGANATGRPRRLLTLLTITYLACLQAVNHEKKTTFFFVWSTFAGASAYYKCSLGNRLICDVTEGTGIQSVSLTTTAARCWFSSYWLVSSSCKTVTVSLFRKLKSIVLAGGRKQKAKCVFPRFSANPSRLLKERKTEIRKLSQRLDLGGWKTMWLDCGTIRHYQTEFTPKSHRRCICGSDQVALNSE